MTRKEYKLTTEQFDKLIEACRSTPLIMLQCGMPASPQPSCVPSSRYNVPFGLPLQNWERFTPSIAVFDEIPQRTHPKLRITPSG